MKDDAHRGIGAVLIAFAVIGLLLWLAMTRLSPQTTLTTKINASPVHALCTGCAQAVTLDFAKCADGVNLVCSMRRTPNGADENPNHTRRSSRFHRRR